MNFDGIPQPWGTLLSLIVGPLGALVVLCVIIYFLWKLFREEQAQSRTTAGALATLTTTVKDLVTELAAYRKVAERDSGK
jgi:fluoride ion exporter CrcB/FEX